jgi:hypothetical protein
MMEEVLRSLQREFHNLIRTQHHKPFAAEVADILVLVVEHRNSLEVHKDLQQV